MVPPHKLFALHAGHVSFDGLRISAIVRCITTYAALKPFSS
jgi:hypothetical protein